MVPKKILKVLNQDPRLKRITHLPLAPLEADRDVFQDLIRSIIYQQLSGKAASTIHARFLKLFTRKKATPRKILNLSIAELRSAGLSFQKAGYVQNIARTAIAQKFSRLDWQAHSDEELMTILTDIKGVGNWTAQIILLFSLHRADVFPAGDVSVQNAIKDIYELEQTGKELQKEMEQISVVWRPYRSWAARYLWAWKDQ